eukprot:5089274-Amphidinium_carterae.2
MSGAAAAGGAEEARDWLPPPQRMQFPIAISNEAKTVDLTSFQTYLNNQGLANKTINPHLQDALPLLRPTTRSWGRAIHGTLTHLTTHLIEEAERLEQIPKLKRVLQKFQTHHLGKSAVKQVSSAKQTALLTKFRFHSAISGRL